MVASADSLDLAMSFSSSMLGENNLAEYATLMAVSGLSPVNNHTTIPAARRADVYKRQVHT